ncbi:hypothetical protein Tco_1222090 [Tanacetum coccineum]
MLIQYQSEVGDSLDRVVTTVSSLEAEQVSGNITKTRSKATLNEPTPQGTGSGVNTPRSDEDIMQLKELMEMCTNLLQRVQDLETTNTAQAITRLKKRVKKLEQRGRSRTPGLKRLYKVGTSRRVESSAEASLGNQEDASKQGRNIAKIDANVDISLVHEDVGIQGRFNDEDMFDTSVFNDEKVFAGQDIADQEVNVTKKEVSAANPVTTADEVVMQEPSEIPRISAAQPQIQEKAQGLRDKGKAKMFEEEEPKEPLKRKDQIKHNEELAKRLEAQLQAEMEEEDRLA